MRLLLLAVSALLAVQAPAQTLPGHAFQYMPLLDTLLTEMWPELELKSMIAAQIEQETCISVKSKGCWNPRTELKTSREYGFGLGQITIIYNSDGSVKSSTFEELKKLGGKLAAWKFEDRFDPEMQLRSMILTEKLQYHKIQFGTASDADRLAFMLSAYNGGIGGIMQDRRLCQKPACDNTKWFGHVAVNSRKAKQPIMGYRTSFLRYQPLLSALHPHGSPSEVRAVSLGQARPLHRSDGQTADEAGRNAERRGVRQGASRDGTGHDRNSRRRPENASTGLRRPPGGGTVELDPAHSAEQARVVTRRSPCPVRQAAGHTRTADPAPCP